MDQKVLTDKSQFPTEDVIFSHIGKCRKYWESVFHYIHTNHPDFTEQWRYYNDGKSWLMKVVRKSKTIFWLSVWNGFFRITFYFGDKAEKAIFDSPVSEKLKQEFKNGKRLGSIRGITVAVNSPADLEDIKSLIAVKLTLK